MRTHVLRSHVTRHGGTIVLPGDTAGADFLTCDRIMEKDKAEMEKLWNQQTPLLAIQNKYILECVAEQKRLSMANFVLQGELPARLCSNKVIKSEQVQATFTLLPTITSPLPPQMLTSLPSVPSLFSLARAHQNHQNPREGGWGWGYE